MKKIMVKTFEESLRFNYAVCEIIKCEGKAYRLAMTETRFVDFCEKHYKEYILEQE